MTKTKVKTFRNPSVTITVRKPCVKSKRKCFSFTLVKVLQDGTRDQKKFETVELDEINEQLLAKKLTYNQALELIENLRERLIKIQKDKLGFIVRDGGVNQSNNNVAQRFLKEEFKKDTCKQTKIGVEMEVLRILKLMGSTSLVTASKELIYKKFWKSTDFNYSPETLKRTLSKLNSLLAIAHRDFKVGTPLNLPRKRIKFIDEDELVLLASELDKPFDKAAVRIMFYTGMRTGELFALQDNYVDFRKRSIMIDYQRTSEWEKKLPKMNKQRKVVYPSVIHDDLEELLDFDESYLISQRRSLTKRVLDASRRLWRR